MIRVTLLGILVSAGGCIITSDSDPLCGDGVRESVEECDDGNLQSGDGCTSTCSIEPYCGDGVKDSDEECDDGNNAANDGCSASCVIEPFCGDGVLDTAQGETCDDGAREPSDGCSAMCRTEVRFATTARWSFSTVGAPTVNLACPGGFDTVAVNSQALRDDGTPVGAPIVDLFTCSTGMGTITPVYQGRYRTFLSVTNTNGTQTYATTTSAIVDLGLQNQTYTAKVFTNGGYFKVAWNLIGAVSNGALTCAQVPGEDGVSVLSTDIANSTSFFDDTFDCEDLAGLTAVLPQATYTVSVSAINTGGNALGIAPTLTNRVIMGPNKVTDLGTITIPIDGL
jgi:cysteine-rich repeat protein